MLQSARKFFWDRRRTFFTVAGLLGGTWFLVRYVISQLAEMRDKVVRDRDARENLRKRFQQNQQDCTYHILALAPPLGNAILEEMHVERITQALQQQRAGAGPPPAPPLINGASLLIPGNTKTMSDSMISSAATSDHDAASLSSHDWVAEFHAQQACEQEARRQRSGGENDSPMSRTSESLLFSGTQTSMSLPPTETDGGELRSGNGTGGVVPAWVASKSKAELWREMKILAFTRALTIVYSLTILSLFTHIQLNLLGTRKYVESVRQLARKNARAAPIRSASVATLFFGSTADLVCEEDDQESQDEKITEQTERKFLTLGWWFLNVGWKDVAERVRSAVEDVFSGVSLKTQIGLTDIEQLISDVRKRVEYQDAESTHTVNFLGTLLPGGELDQEFVLLQGGLSSQDAHIDPSLRSLILSTCQYVSSADFGVVLRVCLDRGADVLIRGLREEVYWGEQDDSVDQPEKGTVRLAAVLPAVARWSHLAVNGIPNELIENLSDVREMTAFSAIMYSSSIDEMAS